jgi:succinate dehydrogenase/fumarate reductase flavoprotein subunit
MNAVNKESAIRVDVLVIGGGTAGTVAEPRTLSRGARGELSQRFDRNVDCLAIAPATGKSHMKYDDCWYCLD